MTPHALLRQQGLVFSVLALVLSLLIAVLPAWSGSVQTILLATLIFVLGVPHGAFDVIFAKRLYRLVSIGQWAVFCVAYVLLAAAVVWVWWVVPSLFLVAFLLVSAFHFSGDLEDGTAAVLRFWYAASMLIFPAWFHEANVAQLFSYLVAGDFAGQMASLLNSMALPWCAGLGVTLVWQCRTSWHTTLEVVSVGVLATTAPPLVGFTVFFCVMHSARHAVRTQAYAAELAWLDLLKQALIPMVICALATAALWPAMNTVTVDAAVIQILFVGLAALTVPHMVLIERVRLAGWGISASPLA